MSECKSNRKLNTKKEEIEDEASGQEVDCNEEELCEAEELLEDVEVSEDDEESSTEESEENSNESEGTVESDEEKDEAEEVLRTIFIKDLDYDTKEEELKKAMKKIGEVVRVTIPLTHDQRRNKGFAYVEFKNLADAQKGLKLDGKEVLGRKVAVSQARPKENKKIYTLFVKNLSYNTTKDELQEHFKKFGNIFNISLPLDNETENRNKGFCFVEYNSEESIQKALKAKHTVCDRTLYISEGNKNEERNDKRSSDRLYGRRDEGRRDEGKRFSGRRDEGKRFSGRRDEGRGSDRRSDRDDDDSGSNRRENSRNFSNKKSYRDNDSSKSFNGKGRDFNKRDGGRFEKKGRDSTQKSKKIVFDDSD
ncbi:hypothetical protein GINT2_002184 [Glugoides intestinalis]